MLLEKHGGRRAFAAAFLNAGVGVSLLLRTTCAG